MRRAIYIKLLNKVGCVHDMIDRRWSDENSSEEKQKMIAAMEEPLLSYGSKRGGFRTMPFIIANEAFEKVASYGLAPNMIRYLMKEYHLDMATGSNIIFFWSAATNFMPVLGAFVADSYSGRFLMIGFGSIFSLVGMILLWLTSVIPQARPPPCDTGINCSPATSVQLLLLCSSFGLMSMGAGGIRSSSLAFGADQILENHGDHTQKNMERYFSWYYASYTFSIFIALTCIVYIQDNLGWQIGFGIPALLMFFSTVSFLLASPFYVKVKAKTSLITGFIQVIVASYRNRDVEQSSWSEDVSYLHEKGSVLVFPSEKLRFMNKACMIRDAEMDLTPEGKAKNPWSLCTVEQVEQLKTLLRMIPLWSTGTIMAINVSQGSFSVLQASSLNRHITSTFQIPAASFGTFSIVSVIIWIAFYDRILIPTASRIMGKHVHISATLRMGIGIALSCLAMLVTAIVEAIRRRTAAFSCEGVVPMSAMWLVPQHCLNGFAEGLNAVAQNEFYFSEFPRNMSSLASTLLGMGMSMANLSASFIMSCVDRMTRSGGKESWVSSDINKGHYDYYFGVLALLSMANLIYFLLCSKRYGPCKRPKDTNDVEDNIENK